MSPSLPRKSVRPSLSLAPSERTHTMELDPLLPMRARPSPEAILHRHAAPPSVAQALCRCRRPLADHHPALRRSARNAG